MDLLKRSLAPLPDAAWKMLDETVARVLKAHLSARTLVDFHGPLGGDFAAVNIGQLQATGQAPNNVPWGVRGVLPLVETRVPLIMMFISPQALLIPPVVLCWNLAKKCFFPANQS